MCVSFVGNCKIITVNNTKVPILMVTCIMFDVLNNVKVPRKMALSKRKGGNLWVVSVSLWVPVSTSPVFNLKETVDRKMEMPSEKLSILFTLLAF